MERKMIRASTRIVLGLLTVALFGCAGFDLLKGSQPAFTVRIPTVTDETNYVWNLLKHIGFYYRNGYKPSFPKDDTIDELVAKATAGTLSYNDYRRLSDVMIHKVYATTDYSTSYKLVADKLDSANSAIVKFKRFRREWGFYIPNHYTIIFTLYGTGGSYDPEEGVIYLKTTKDGGFTRSPNPLDTIIHEAVHIGIEKAVVKRYGISQWTKERIVDQFMMHNFLDICPDYRMQPNPETAIDSVLDNPDVWHNLPAVIEQYMESTKGMHI
jgi:hypothetical protein